MNLDANWNPFKFVSDQQQLPMVMLWIALTLYGTSSFYTYSVLQRLNRQEHPNHVLNTSSHSHSTHATHGKAGTSTPPLHAPNTATNTSTSGINIDRTIASNTPTIQTTQPLTSLSQTMRANILHSLALAFVLRCLCLLLEYYASLKLPLYHSNSSPKDGTNPLQYEITYIVARTLPFQSFIIAYTGIVLFYHSVVQLALTGPVQQGLVPNGPTGTVSGSASTTTTAHTTHPANAFGGGPISNRALPNTSSNVQSSSQSNLATTHINISNTHTSSRSSPSWISTFNIAKIQSNMTLDQLNIYGYGIYFFFIIFNSIVPVLDGTNLQMILDFYFAIWYSFLWIALMVYSGALLRTLQKSLWDNTLAMIHSTTTVVDPATSITNMAEHTWSTSVQILAWKMISLVIVCSIALTGRASIEVMSMWNHAHYHSSTWDRVCQDHANMSEVVSILNYYCSSKFTANLCEYILLEYIPAITCVMMLKKHSSFHGTVKDLNDSSSQYVKRKPFAVGRDGILLGLETGQGSIPQNYSVDGHASSSISHSAESIVRDEMNRSNSANAGTGSAPHPRMNSAALPRPYSSLVATNASSVPLSAVGSVSGVNARRSISENAASSSEMNPLLGEHSQSGNSIRTSFTVSYGGV